MSRLENSIRNIRYAVIGQVFGMIISFFSRMVFVHILGNEYLGLNGLFSNILSVLSIAELGIGTSIVFSMYKPLAEGDNDKLKALISLYKKAYIAIGMVIAILGIALTPFLKYIIKDMPDISYLSYIYMMFILNSSISYFFSYKRSLIIADQKRYIVTLYRYSFYFFMNIAQIILLLLTRNYILFLSMQIICTVVENICISYKANRMYPYILDKYNIARLEKDDRKQIIRNVKAMIYHKLGTTVVMGTDNILIARFIGIVEVGLYSNYQLIINALDSVFSIMFQSLTASIGNLGVKETTDKSKFIFECINLLCFWIHAFSSICLIVLLNPFIALWLNEKYIFSADIVLLIVINFYLSGMRKSVQTFKEALGLFWYDRYKPLFESGINLIVSIVLALRFGINGILIGTIISTLTTCFWVEPYILYKYGFKASVTPYFLKYILYSCVMVVIGMITLALSSTLVEKSITSFCVKILICGTVPNILFLFIFSRTKEFRYIINILKESSMIKSKSIQ